MKKKSLIDRMSEENKTICEYCGAEKEGVSFMIGASKEPDWVMVEGTGKMACPKPECQKRGYEEGQAAIKRHTGL